MSIKKVNSCGHAPHFRGSLLRNWCFLLDQSILKQSFSLANFRCFVQSFSNFQDIFLRPLNFMNSALRLSGLQAKRALSLKMMAANGHGSSARGTIYRLKKNNDNSDIIERLVGILQKGGVIAVPTDTLYGIACLAQSTEAIEKIYDLKGRDRSKPIAICVGEVYDVFQWGRFPKLPIGKAEGDGLTNRPEELLEDLLPGPVTVVTERSSALNMDLNPDTQLVGIRIPDHKFIRNLTNRLKEPLALTSANLSSALSPLSIDDFDSLHEKLDAIVDGGHILDGSAFYAGNARKGSTVFRILQDSKSFKVIRPGCAYDRTVKILSGKWGLQLVP